MKFIRFYLYGFFIVGANSMVSIFLSLYLKQQGVSESVIGNLLGINQIMMPIVMLSLGMIADRISCRRMIMAGSLISIFFCSAMPSLKNTSLMTLAVCLDGIGINLAFITINILFIKIIPVENRGKRMAFMIGSQQAGYAIGSAISSLLLRNFNLDPVTIFYGALPGHAICFFLALKLQEAPIERFPLGHYLHDMRRIPAICLALVTFTLGLHWGSERFVTVRFMDEVLGAKGMAMAALFLVSGLTLAASSRLGGRIIDTREDFVTFLSFGMLVSGLMHALCNWTLNYPLFLLARILHTMGDGIVTFGVPMLVSQAFPSGRMGGNYGFNRMINSIGAALGSWISGFLAARYFIGSSFVATGLIQLASALVIWAMRNHLSSIKVRSEGNTVMSPVRE